MKKTRIVDPVLFGLAAFVTIIGVFFVFDAGYPREIAAGRSPLSSSVIQQIGAGILGVILFAMLPRLSEKWLRTWSIAVWTASVGGLVLCMLPGIGVNLNGASRWFKLPGLPMVQPAEFVKLTTILLLATVLADRKPWQTKPGRDLFEWMDRNLSRKVRRTVPLMLVLGTVYMIEREPDMGTACVVLAIAIVMHLFAGLSKTSIYVGSGLLAALLIALTLGAGYRMDRIRAHDQRWSTANLDDVGYQSVQAELAIAEGKWFGVGPGNGRAKHVMPAATTDFISATIAEEFGLVGMLTIMSLLALICFRLIKLAQTAQTAVGKLVLCGVATWVGVQATVNILMANSLLPPIGVPLPFISYGGSSLLALWIALGVANAAHGFRTAEERSVNASDRHRWRHGRTRLSRA